MLFVSFPTEQIIITFKRPTHQLVINGLFCKALFLKFYVNNDYDDLWRNNYLHTETVYMLKTRNPIFISKVFSFEMMKLQRF